MISSMEIGNLRHRITLQKMQVTRDSFGAEVQEWVDTATLWAKLEPLSGKEFFAAQQIMAEVSLRITIRYLKGVEPKQRLRFLDRHLEILSVVNPNEGKKELQLMCREVV